jgi:hypothetical protein
MISYYFTNFPDNSNQVDLWKVFQRWGKVREVFLPNKRNKFGKRFGFVRFLDVNDPKKLEVKLDSIKINETKLHVNLPRFSKMEGKTRTPVVAKKAVGNNSPRYFSNSAKDMSFVQVVAQGGGMNKVPTHRNTRERACRDLRIIRNDKGALFSVQEERISWLEKCLVGRFNEVTPIEEFREIMVEEGFSTVTFTPMGDDWVLLSPTNEEDLLSLFTGKEEIVAKWFYSLKWWTKSLFAGHRRVWLACYRILLHVWSEEFFRSIALDFGVF